MNKTLTTLTDYFIWKAWESGDQITHLKIQKLLFYSQALFLANCEKELFEEDFQAWVHWPVLKSVYIEFKHERPWAWINKDIEVQDLKARVSEVSEDAWEDIFQYLEFIADEYLWYTWFMLENMTHQEAPWKDARKWLQPDEISENIITKESMQKYYWERLA